MKDEIKEILDMLEFSNDSVMWCDKVTLNTKQSHLLLDYITNLQEENERLKVELISKPDIEWELETKDGQKFTIIQSKRIDMQETLNKSLEEMCKQKEDYKSRCEKALEYITSYEAISIIQGLDKIEQNKKLEEKTMNVMVERYLKVHHKLLNILQVVGKDE